MLELIAVRLNHMKIVISLAILLLISLLSASGQEATLTLKGNITDTLYFSTYKRAVPKSRKAFSHYLLNASAKTEHVFTIPDSICNQRLYLSCNNTFTFLELKAGQHLSIYLNGKEMQFSGDTHKINQYLY